MKSKKPRPKRKYEKKRRAETERETRQRIVDALVALHGSVGPARTTVQAVAEKAGVQRATVYRHFPDEPSMLAACSAHWAAENPFPDLDAWAAIDDPERRVRTALADLYSFYDTNESMLTNTTRDEALVAALEPSMQSFRDYLAAAGDVLRKGIGIPPDDRLLVAAIGHALTFGTWRSLCVEHGLPTAKAAGLMAGLVLGTRSD